MSHTLPLCTISPLLSFLFLDISRAPSCGGAVVLIVVSTIMLGPMEACNEDGHTPDVGEGVLSCLVIITLICLVTVSRYRVLLFLSDICLDVFSRCLLL